MRCDHRAVQHITHWKARHSLSDFGLWRDSLAAAVVNTRYWRSGHAVMSADWALRLLLEIGVAGLANCQALYKFKCEGNCPPECEQVYVPVTPGAPVAPPEPVTAPPARLPPVRLPPIRVPVFIP